MIQLNTLEDRSVHDKQHWDGAIKFLSENVTGKLEGNENTLREMVSLIKCEVANIRLFPTVIGLLPSILTIAMFSRSALDGTRGGQGRALTQEL